MSGWMLYLIVGGLIAHNDAVLCFATKRRFRMWPSLTLALFWPIALPVVIVGAYVVTRNMPPTSADADALLAALDQEG